MIEFKMQVKWNDSKMKCKLQRNGIISVHTSSSVSDIASAEKRYPVGATIYELNEAVTEQAIVIVSPFSHCDEDANHAHIQLSVLN